MAQPIKVPKYSDAVQRKGFIKGPAGISLEQAKAEMEAAKEPVSLTRGTFVPKHLDATSPRSATRGQGGNSPKVNYTPAEIADAEESLQSASQTSLPATPTRTAAQPTAPVAAKPIVQDGEVQPAISYHEVLNELEFTVETYKDNRDGKWYGVVNYNPDANGNQPGAERFIANTPAELTLKIFKGKAHSTLKIRSLTQSHKLGGKPDLPGYFEAELQKTHGLTVDAFNALPTESRAAITNAMYAAEAMLFKDQHPEYNLGDPEGAKNLQAVVGHVRKQGWPITRRNLEIGWNDLEAAKKIETVNVSPVSSAPMNLVVPAQPARKRGSFTSGLVPGHSSVESDESANSEMFGTRQAAARKNAETGGLTPEQRIKELSKTTEGMAQLKKEMRAGFRTPTPSYKG